MTRRSRTVRFAGEHAPARRQTPSPTGRPRSEPSRSRPLRLAAFAVIALVIGGGAIGLVVTRLQGPGSSDTTAVQVHASMGGFDPPAMTVKAGETVKVELSSMDTSMHSDGGGWHQFAIDALDIDWKVGPLSSEIFEFTAPAAAGTYSWYCDICCGGKENPSMQGKLTVTA
jgi:cytochrome c oxidase subunit 2